MKVKSDLSYGIMPLRRCSSGWETLLVQHRNGKHYSFPKGHPEPWEAPQETASRELHEESGLSIVEFLSQDPFWESYSFKNREILIHKKVGYFPAIVKGDLMIQEEEIETAIWVSLQDANSYLTFEEAKSLCLRLIDFLEKA